MSVPFEIVPFVKALDKGPLKSLDKHLSHDALFYRIPESLTTDPTLDCVNIFFPVSEIRMYGMSFQPDLIDVFFILNNGMGFSMILNKLLDEHIRPYAKVELSLSTDPGIRFMAEFTGVRPPKVKRISKEERAIIDAVQASTKDHDI
jgi:hypothetical protein